MSNMRRSKRLVALAAGLSLDRHRRLRRRRRRRPAGTEAPRPTQRDDRRRRDDDDRPAKPPRPPKARVPPRRACRAAPGDVAMTVTIELNPDAVWEDGIADHVGRPRVHVAGHVEHARLDRDRRLRPDLSASSRARATSRSSSLEATYGPYKRLFTAAGPIIKKAAVEDCMRHLRRVQHRAADLRPQHHAAVVERGPVDVRARTRATRVTTSDGRPGRLRPADGHRHRAGLDQGRPGRLHLPAVLCRASSDELAVTRTSSSTSRTAATTRRLYFQQLDGPFADPASARRSPCRSTARRCSTRSTARSSRPPDRGQAQQLRPDRRGAVYCPPDNFQDTTTRPRPRRS